MIALLVACGPPESSIAAPSQCDLAKLDVVAAGNGAPDLSYGAIEARQRETSQGIRKACPDMPTWLNDRMRLLWETSPDERPARLADVHFDDAFVNAAELRARVCPRWDTDVMMRVAHGEPDQRMQTAWRGCELARYGVYLDEEIAAGNPVPSSVLVEHFVYQYLLDQHVGEVLAKKIVRRFATVANLVPPLSSESSE